MQQNRKWTRGAWWLFLIALTLQLVQPVYSATGDPVLINEVLASHTGPDDTEYIEFFGSPGASLAGLSLIIVESDSGSSQGNLDRQIDFGPDDRLGQNGFYLVGNPTGLAAVYGVTPNVSIGDNFLENSSLTVALIETSSLSGNTVSGNEVIRDAVGLTDGGPDDFFYFSAAVVGPTILSFGPVLPAGARRVVDGVDTDTAADWVISDFNLGSDNTPTAGDTPPPPPPPVVSIMDIQGQNQFSDFDGQTVETSGIVTLFTANGANFWLQDPAGDGNATTSDGIFVSGGGFPASGPRPAVGDQIRIIATVQEQQFGNALPLTRLRSVALIEVLSSGNPLPAPVPLVDLPNESVAESIDLFESLEGMLVSLSDARVVGPTNRFGEFVVLTATDADADLNSGYFAQAKQILLRSPAPNVVDYNPERILVDDSSLDSPIVVNSGDRVKNLMGVVDYSFGNYKLQPASLEVKTHKLPNLPASKRSGPGGDAVITSFNVENLFDLSDDPVKDDEGSTPTSEELDAQLHKLALALAGELELPEIVVVQEVENTAILQELGDQVNATNGTDYQAISFETSDARGIEVGFLWDADRVSLLEAFQLSGPDIEAAFGPNSASPGREPLYGKFQIRDQEIVIVGNHFKSKGGDDPIYGLSFNRITEVQRKMQARAVRDFVNGILEADPNTLLMVTGDLNDFQFGEPNEGSDHPLAILAGGDGEIPLTNLVNLEKAAEQYSFIFDGNSQVLDHMLVSPALLDRFAAVDILHFNASFADALGNDSATPLRAADHDPLEARFNLK